uniref:Uncharacterized protein n=1 Tax=Leptobrachium leishanense TaxID=445787 RepID=A0A8C5QRY0_9ANUR
KRCCKRPSINKELYWIEPGAHFISLEATAYALLALLELKQYELTGPIARWLTEQRYIGVGYGSTQATIVYFQGQAQYQQDIPSISDVNLDVSVRLPERNQPITYRINTDNAMLARSAQTRVNKGFVVSMLNPLFIHLKDADATMSIIDVSMLTGFAPDVEELNKLARGVDKYISKFEINKDATERGTLIIYLDSVSHKQEECVKVVAHQIFRVGLIQPASVTVYDYYNPGKLCVCAIFALEDCATVPCDCAGSQYILSILPPGTDADPLQQERNFISHRNCRDKLEMLRGRDYLIWGVTGDLWLQPSGYSYIIGKETWIEWWPNDRECQNPENEQLCNDYFVVSENLAVVGCPN